MDFCQALCYTIGIVYRSAEDSETHDLRFISSPQQFIAARVYDMTWQELTEHIFYTYSVEPEHPFQMDGISCVFRHADNRKWFALTMNVPYRTLGMAKEGRADILNVKCDPILIGSLRGKSGFLPAYHMNKDNWITILLDGPPGGTRSKRFWP